MLKLMVLLPFAPRLDANHGGSRVMAQLLVHLAERHRVALLYLRAADEPPIDEGLQERSEILREVNRPLPATTPASRWFLRLRILRSFLRRKPIWATVWSVPAYRKELGALATSWQPDIVQLEYHIMGQYLSAIKDISVPRILTLHEPGARAARDLERTTKGYKRLLNFLDRRAWDEYERRIFRQLDTVVVFTERDRQLVHELNPATPTAKIPLQVPPLARPLDPLGQAPPNMLFVGNFMHPPNVDAAIRLVRDIVPSVQEQVPDAHLYIVGDQPPPLLRQFGGNQVTVTGLVPDVLPYLDRATVVVAPLRMGGGMRVKVLEALAAGKAIVASPLAVEGLDLTDGENIVIADDDAQFAAGVARLLIDSQMRQSIATAAYRWAQQNMSRQRTIEAYENLYAQLRQAASRERARPTIMETT